MTLRWSIPDETPIVRCQTCGEEVVVITKNKKVIAIGYKSVTMGDKDKLVGFEHRCKVKS